MMLTVAFVAVIVVVVVVVAVVVVALVRRGGGRTTGRGVSAPSPATGYRPAMEGPFLGPVATVRLDVDVDDPSSPPARRLADRAAARVLQGAPDVDEVVVEDRGGTVVARVPRRTPSAGPPPTRPEQAGHGARPHGSWEPPMVVPGVDQDVDIGRRSLAERLELPDVVRRRVRRPDDPVDLVRALFEAAGRPVEVHGSVVRCGDDVVIVADDTPVDAGAALSRAFLQFRDSGASRGVVVHVGYVDAREVARRRALAPTLHHAGPDVLQEMADAVELGGDPMAFALAGLVD